AANTNPSAQYNGVPERSMTPRVKPPMPGIRTGEGHIGQDRVMTPRSGPPPARPDSPPAQARMPAQMVPERTMGERVASPKPAPPPMIQRFIPAPQQVGENFRAPSGR